MKEKRLLDKIRISTNDILIMAACLGVTILISFVYYNYGSIKSTFNTVVEIKDDGKMVATEKDGQPLRDFTVKITAKSTEKLEESSVHAFIDLRSRIEDDQYVAVSDEGVYDFPIVVELDNAGTSAEFNKFEYSPKTVKLKVEHKTEEWIKIVPTFSGELGAQGFEISEKTLSPDKIKISGGRSIVEKTKADTLTTEAIDISKITNKFTPTTIEVTPKFSILDSRLKIDIPQDTKFTLTVKLAPIQGQQSYSGIPVNFANLDDRLEITNNMVTVSVSLKGSEISLEKIDTSKILVIADCISITGEGTYEIPLSVSAPLGTTILDQPSSIRIWVKEIFQPVTDDIPEDENAGHDENTAPEKEEDQVSSGTESENEENELEEVLEQELL
ncbi:MAG: hypothetical protein II563_03335 [Treponema sp.]|nr:hypothetical protein [Treponema sp.]MBQ2551867.1 hypothetical protein [Treponema sp.]MBQ4235896.1 hypothetical protein [Treponema sp.]MBQ5384448.1 hypothetical protein [Treponema sp.]